MLSHQLDFRPERDAEIFAAAPAAPAVFLLRGSDPQAEPYVSKTANLRRRLIRTLGAPDQPSRKLNLRGRVAQIEWAPTGSDFESTYVLYKVLRQTFPKSYQDRLRLRMAPLARLHLDNRYPRVSITTHLGSSKSSAVYYGPFPSRAAAEKFANDALDFFKMRRCVEELNPDPAFPGCVYSEMKMCLAPCFKGCTDEQYTAEVARVESFIDSHGQSLMREIAAARDKASADLEFETAAALHAQLEKLKPVVAQLPEIVQRVDRLRALMIQPSAAPDSVALFHVEHLCISGPITFAVNVPQPAGKPLSMEARVVECLGQPGTAAPTCSRQEAMEQLAILKRWYYRTSKSGEIFFADDTGQLPLRRVVRGISRVFRGEKPTPDLNETARNYWINRGREAEIDGR